MVTARLWLWSPFDALFRELVVYCECSPCFASLTHLIVRAPNGGHPDLVAVALNCSLEDQEDLDVDLDQGWGRQAGLADSGNHPARLVEGREEICHQESPQVVETAFLEVDLEEAGH